VQSPPGLAVVVLTGLPFKLPILGFWVIGHGLLAIELKTNERPPAGGGGAQASEEVPGSDAVETPQPAPQTFEPALERAAKK